LALVKVNGQHIGETGAKTFFRLNLTSGMYLLASEAENTSELQINLVEGQNILFGKRFGWGFGKPEIR
jgi:hypothetical protein